MTGTELASLINYRCKTNTTTFPAADMLVLVNLMKDELASRIQQVRQKVWNIPAVDDLVLNQREYAFPDDVLNSIVSLELKFTATGKYVLAEPLARRHYKDTLEESKIINNFDNLNPRYFLRRKAIYILSGAIITVIDGIKLVYNSFPADLANLTGTADLSIDPSITTHGFSREFHELWARRTSIEYKDANNKKLSQKELEYDKDLEKALDDFSIVDLNRKVIASLPSGSERGDNGADY